VAWEEKRASARRHLYPSTPSISCRPAVQVPNVPTRICHNLGTVPHDAVTSTAVAATPTSPKAAIAPTRFGRDYASEVAAMQESGNPIDRLLKNH
jgi:hypothetical protein